MTAKELQEKCMTHHICEGCIAHSYWESDGHYCHRFGKKCASVRECKKKNRKRNKKK